MLETCRMERRLRKRAARERGRRESVVLHEMMAPISVKRWLD
jgi:hypothetical protein